MLNWSPGSLNDLTSVSIVMIASAAFWMSLVRGWLVLGKHHRELMDVKDAVLAEHRERSVVDAETIHEQAQVIATKTGAEEISLKLLQALREADRNA